jgi:hypothetical protein
MFKERLSHIDYCYINIFNLKQLYDDCLAGKVDPSKLDKQVLDFFGFQMKLINILTQQMSSKSQTLPYAIKSFCKCLYQTAKNKFADCTFNDLARLVGHYLLDMWLLDSAFLNLCSEGLSYEYFLPTNTRQNFELMHRILSEIMTFRRKPYTTNMLKI